MTALRAESRGQDETSDAFTTKPARDPAVAEPSFRARDALDQLCIAAVQLEALANAANTAMDEYGVPSAGARRDFERVHALVSATAEAADAYVELTRTLKESVRLRCSCRADAPAP
jgi:hypothetical protein